MNYKYPDSFEFEPSFIIGGKTKEAIVCAAKYMDEHPDIDPKFEQVFNVLLNADKETVSMTKAVFDMAGIKESTTPVPLLDEVCFPIYARAVITIKHIGWDGYIKAISAKETESA